MILPRLSHVPKETELAGGRVVDFAGRECLFEPSERAVPDIGTADDQDFVG